MYIMNYGNAHTPSVPGDSKAACSNHFHLPKGLSETCMPLRVSSLLGQWVSFWKHFQAVVHSSCYIVHIIW